MSNSELQRTEILELIGRPETRLALLLAPAGFGKTTVARQFGALHPPLVVCDCFGVTSQGELCRRILESLVRENPASSGHLALAQLSAPDEDALRTLVLGAWSAPGGQSTFVFENAEHLAAVEACLALIESLLDVRTDKRRVLICSRVRLEIASGRFAAPHETRVITAAELRFSDTEVRRLFENDRLSDVDARRIEAVSRGWPVVAILLRDVLRHGELDGVLEKIGQGELPRVESYLARHVFAALTPWQRSALRTIALVPAATLPEIAVALEETGEGTSLMHRLLSTPLVSRESDGSFAVHPLLRALVINRELDTARTLVARVADNQMSRGERVRAAQLFLALGDQERAASALGKVEAYLAGPQSYEAMKVLTALEPEVLLRHPAIWNAVTPFRSYAISPERWIEDSRTVWESLTPETELDVVLGVMGNIVNAYANLGQFAEADRILSDVKRLAPAAIDPVPHFVVELWRTVLTAYRGWYFDLDRFLVTVSPLLQTDYGCALMHYEIVSRVHRLRGDAVAERAAADIAVERAAASGVSLPMALCTVDAAVGAWILGDDERCEALLADVERHVDVTNEKGLRFFLDCARGRATTAVPGYEKRKSRAYAYLMAAARAEHLPNARFFATQAVAAADESAQGYVRVLTRLAVSCLSGRSDSPYLLEAIAIASELDSPRLKKTLAILRRRSNETLPMLGAFVGRFAPRGRQAAVRISIGRGNVQRDGFDIEMPEKELELLTAIAKDRRPVGRETLIDTIWSNASEETGRNNLKAHVTRIRRRLGEDDAIRFGPQGYALGDGIDVDLLEAESFLAGDATGYERSRARTLFATFDRPPPERMRQWEWWPLLEIRLVRTAEGLARIVGWDDAWTGRHLDALAFADWIAETEPASSVAADIRVCVQLARGDLGAARIAYAQYIELAAIAEKPVEPAIVSRMSALG